MKEHLQTSESNSDTQTMMTSSSRMLSAVARAAWFCSHTCSSESRGAEATPLLMVLPVVSIWLQYLAQPRY